MIARVEQVLAVEILVQMVKKKPRIEKARKPLISRPQVVLFLA